MTHEEARKTARAMLKEYAEKTLTKSKNGFYVCPFCGSGSGKNGTGAFRIDDTGERWKCFSCNRGGDIFALIGTMKGVGEDTPEAFTETRKELNIDLYAEYTPVKEEAKAEEAPTDYTTFFLQAAQNIEACDYLDRRGISKETQKRFCIGYVEQWKHPKAPNNAPATPRVIIPTSKESYLARDTREDAEAQYKKQKAGKIHIFNLMALKTGKPCFVVEGEIDALSIIEAGADAIGLGSTANVKTLLDHLKTEPTEAPLILCFDNDSAGAKAQAELSAGLKDLQIEFYTADILNGAKDPNEALVKDREAFTAAVNAAVNKKAAEYKQTSAGNRIDLFTESVRASAKTPPIQTGFRNLDNALDGGIIPALYVLGAISSLGKTTFVLQIADQIAAAGQDVLIFSLEMSEFELMAKSLSRLTFKHCEGKQQNAKTVRGLLNGAKYSGYNYEEITLIERAKKAYGEYAQRIYIKQGNISNTGVAAIEEAVKQHISFTGNTPVVIIDYLQIIKPFSDRATDKQSTDYNISMLKNLCRNYNLPIIGVSSFNRDNYNSPVNMAAFKESGSLEYSADVLLALQPEGMTDGPDENGKMLTGDKLKAHNTDKVNKCKAASERNVELVILKNRNGSTNKTLRFRYFAMFNSFEEVEEKNYCGEYLETKKKIKT